MHPTPRLLHAAFFPAAFSLFAALLAFAAAPARAAYTEQIVHNFTDTKTDGATPNGGLVIASDGTIYGATGSGGLYDDGTVYKIDTSGKLSLIYSFGKSSSDGINPSGSLLIGSDGSLYGTCAAGGTAGDGTVFKVTTAGAETVLHSFQGGDDGEAPISGLTLGSDGNLYGTTSGQNDQSSVEDLGTIYSLSTTGSGYLVQFRFTNDDAEYGTNPVARLVKAPGSGNSFYGLCFGDNTDQDGGTLFSMQPGTSTNSAKLTLLRRFGDGSVANDPTNPECYDGLVLDSSGNLYGTTQGGGVPPSEGYSGGTIFEYSPSSGKTTLLYTFASTALPLSGLTLASDGNLYGAYEPAGQGEGNGAVYRISPSGSGYSVVYNFGDDDSQEDDGASPDFKPVEDSSGNLIGTTYSGGKPDSNGDYDGLVYKLLAGLPHAITLSSLAVSPSSIFGGGANATGTVTLSGTAPSGGTVVKLASSNTSAATVPSSVTVASGDSQATFTITSHAVTSSTKATITATYGSGSKTASLTVTPPGIKSVTLSPTSTEGGTSTTANRVYWTSDAPANETVTLTSSNTAVATVPSSVTISSGSSSHTFTITTKAVTSLQTVTITAKNGSVTQTATLTVTAPAATGLKSVELSPASTPGGTTTTANRVYWNGDAPANETVTLTSSNTAVATVPSSVTIAANASSHTFSITTKAVTSNQTVTITATSGGVKKTATLTITPAAVVPTSISCSPNPIYSDGTTTITVKLSGPAPSGGLSISLSDDGSTFYTDTVPAGQTTYQDTVSVGAVTSSSTLTVGATANNVTVTTNLTVDTTSVTLKSFSFSPSSVKGGDDSTGTVTLSAAAPAGGAVVEIDEEGDELGTLTIPAGQSSATFDLSTDTTTSTTKYTYTANYNNASKTATLTVTP